MNVKEIKGRTDFSSGQFLGYVLWKHHDGFHLRWTTKGKKERDFQGKIIFHTRVLLTKKLRAETKDNIEKTDNKTIKWDTTLNKWGGFQRGRLCICFGLFGKRTRRCTFV